jgi:acetyl/propionyl-CoA carboxylase alpha subunit/acetyl-CoA carboxylase carboxyltransferase component
VISRIAIVNRGEPAVRLIRAVREWNRERGTDVRVIALATHAERRAMFVRLSDEVVIIAPRPGGAATPYLDLDALRDGLVTARADTVWVGWGFVAERPEFADLCDEMGITFIGPSAEVMRKLGDKIGSKLLAEGAGVPVSPWSGGPVRSVEEAIDHATRIGYPLVVKATAGGGGRGIRFVDSEDELPAAIESAQGEALRSFGDGTVFMEKLVGDARHIEVQIVADGAGNVWALGVRDCSVQRRRQKVLEESRSVALDAEAEEAIKSAAIRLARVAGYRNAGTVEFLFQPGTGDVAFLEVNTRLQVEHPVTEETTGVDIVKLQLHVADGGTLDGDPPVPEGHAIEARLNAEDPDRGFAPAPGTIAHLQLPAGPGIRVDSGVAAGDVIPSEYDSMIAKIIAVGRDRGEALARLSRALSETTVVVTGGSTNKSFLLDLLERDEVRTGDVDTGWLDRLTAAPPAPRPYAGVALVAAAVAAAREEEQHDQSTFFAMAARGRPQPPAERSHHVEFRVGGRAYEVDVHRVGLHRFVVVVEGSAVVLESDRMGDYLSRLIIGDRAYRVLTVVDGASTLVEVDGVAHRISRDEGGLVRAPAPGLVVGLAVSPGDEVAAGATVAVLEAMKMETAVTTPSAGRVREVLVTANVQVPAGAPLVRVDVIADTTGEQTGEAIDVSDLAQAAADAPRIRATDSMLALILGMDYTDELTGLVLDRYAEDSAADGDRPVDAEIHLLGVFADVLALARNRRAGSADETAHNEREHLLAYLASLEIAKEKVPPSFEPKLRRALAHYGVDSLERNHDLRVALYRLYLAIDEAGSHLPVIEAVLGRVESAEPTDELRGVLDRLIDATQLRFPYLGERVRRLRTRLFDAPQMARRQDRAYERVFELLDAVDRGDPSVSRAEAMTELGMCPYPLVGLLPARLEVTAGRPEPLVEAIIRRYYRAHDVSAVENLLDEGLDVVVGRQLDPDGTHAAVAAVAAPDGALGRAMSILDRHVGDLPTDGELFLVGAEAVDEPAVLDARVRQELARLTTPGPRRLAVSFIDHTGATSTTLWYSPDAGSPDGWAENVQIRGIHPMIAERMHLWRLAEFDLERLPSAAEVMVLRCTAKSDPSDQRFVVLAEVRDLTVVRNELGEISGLPEAEHALVVAINELRNVDGGEAAPDWNRIVLYLWSDINVPLSDLATVARRVAPLTEGIGLEQVMVYARTVDADGAATPVVIRVSVQSGAGVTMHVTTPPDYPMAPRSAYEGNVMRSRQRGAVYPFELVPLIVQRAGQAPGTFTELDLDDTGALVPVERPPGANSAAIIVGLVRTPTEVHPDGIERVALFGDPLKALGSLAEPECARISAAVGLARRREIPIEWFALSAGAKISMDSGTENMDWIARTLRDIVEFTQDGGEINIVVAGINVGAQPYWNAEATMLMHTKGILVMTPDGAMVLTGKQALDYSGGVSAEDNFGIGGYDRIMGPNGQAQYWAPDLAGAVGILFRHYAHSYVAPGERSVRRAHSSDPVERDVRDSPHPPELGLSTVGEVFSEATNPGRKKPFDIRAVIRAVADVDHELLERWADMRDADSAVVVDAHLGGFPVTLIGIESKPLARFGLLNADGPDQWSAGTLFPLSSKKVARGINAASGSRPAVILANLSGFDGSPESLRRVQLEYGAEIGRAVVNFQGPIVFCVISRYHGGAFVVFSATLNDNMQILALEGSFASVIGGAPAAAVVFAGEVNRRTRADERVRSAARAVQAAQGPERGRLQAELDRVHGDVRSEVLGAVAGEFDAVHSIQRAQEIGSVHRIISAARLRPELIEAVERGLARTDTG